MNLGQGSVGVKQGDVNRNVFEGCVGPRQLLVRNNPKEDTVKKVAIIASLVALMAGSSFADVQNIRLSGDIRIRGYYLNGIQSENKDNNVRWNGNQYVSDGYEEATFITQRTRVTCEADLEDHVLVVVTLKAEGQWGSEDQGGYYYGNGAGAGGSYYYHDNNDNHGGYWPGYRINRGWEVGINEAYLQLNQVFFTPATLKIGRQYLNYGRGLILSSNEGEYNFDAARLVLDYYPLTVDFVAAMLVNNQNFTSYDIDGKATMLFANARYEFSDSLLKAVEVYGGWIMQDGDSLVGRKRVPPTYYSNYYGGDYSGYGASPAIVGVRADANLTKNLATWAEFAYEFGADGSNNDESISAYIANIGGRFTLADVKLSPAINANYTYASGGGRDGKNNFRPWFDYSENYNGFIFKPTLSNIQVINLGGSIKPANNCTLAVQGYYYLLAGDRDGVAMGNSNIEIGSPIIGGGKREIGWEIDAILGYDYSKDVRCQLIYGAFIPDRGIHEQDDLMDRVAHGVRGEINVKF